MRAGDEGVKLRGAIGDGLSLGIEIGRACGMRWELSADQRRFAALKTTHVLNRRTSTTSLRLAGYNH